MFNDLKDSIRKKIIPLASHIPLSPNILTLLGLLISLIAAWAFSLGDLITGGVLVLLSGLFDILDGAVARAKDSITPFGGVLDSIADRYADALIFAGIIYGSITGNIMSFTALWLWCILALIGSYMVSYSRARAEAAGVKAMNIGIAERSERMLLLVLGAFTGFLLQSIIVIVFITHITLVQRVLFARKTLNN